MRVRSFLGARAAFNGRNSTVNCTIRNYSEHGAQLRFAEPPRIPDMIEVVLANRAISAPAQVVWRSNETVGVMFPGGRFMMDDKKDAAAVQTRRQVRTVDDACY